MSTVIWNKEGGDLLIMQQLGAGLTAARYGLGGLLLAAGGYMTWMMIEGPLSFYRNEGSSGLASALPGMFVSGVLAAILLPLGAWICFMRKRWRVDNRQQEVIEETDWRIRRTRKARALANYEAVWVGIDTLNVASGSRKGTPVFLAQVRLLPREPKKHPVIDLGFSEQDQIEKMKELAGMVASETGLPMQVDEASAIGKPAAAGARR